MQKLIEIACFNLESVQIAQNAGADRIELCQNYKEGGLTPSKEWILAARKELHIPLHVIIRPRSGNFVYSKSELNEMKNSIIFCKEAKVNGLVFGCLSPHNKVDEVNCNELLSLANPLPVTFHRAIDSCLDISESLEKIIKLGFKRVLTSGGKINALEGVENIKALNTQFGKSITIIAGGAIRSTNISKIRKVSACQEFHSAAILDDKITCDANEIKKIKSVLLSDL